MAQWPSPVKRAHEKARTAGPSGLGLHQEKALHQCIAARVDIVTQFRGAAVGVRVGGHEFRRTLSLRLGAHQLPQAHLLFHVIPGIMHVIDAELIGLQLVLAAIGQDHAKLHGRAAKRADRRTVF